MLLPASLNSNSDGMPHLKTMAVVVRSVQTYAVCEYLDAGHEDLGQLSSRAVEPLKCMRRQKS